MKIALYVITIVILGSFLPAFGFEPESMDCATKNLDYVKFLYKSHIDGINDAVRLYKQSHPNYTMPSLVSYIYSPFLNTVSDSAQCLENLGINPQNVAQLSPDAQKVLSYDPGRLNNTAPLFVKHVYIPEFPIMIPILSLGFILLLVFHKTKFGTRIKHVFW